jgi:hypothetical protein
MALGALNIFEGFMETIIEFPNRTTVGYEIDSVTHTLVSEVTIYESPADWQLNCTNELCLPVWLVPANVTLEKPESEDAIFHEKWIYDRNNELYKNSLEVIKEKRREFLNVQRDILMSSGFYYKGNSFDSDPISIQKINGIVTLALIFKSENKPLEIVWTTKENTQVTFNIDDIIDFGKTCTVFIDSLHHECVNKKEEVMKLDSIIDILKYEW